MKTRCSPCQLLCCDRQPVGYAQTPLCLTHVLPCNPVFQMLISGGVLLPKILRGTTDPRRNYEVDESWVHPCLGFSLPPCPPVSTLVTHHSRFLLCFQRVHAISCCPVSHFKQYLFIYLTTSAISCP